jgi:DNA-directed RNA polymerase subunit RPC12/RpoP
MQSVNINKFQCSICQFQFKTKAGANRHFSTSHQNKQKYKCDYCHYRGSRQDTLKKHLEIHRNQEQYVMDNSIQAGATGQITSQQHNESKAGEECAQPPMQSTSVPEKPNEILEESGLTSTINWSEVNALLSNQNNNTTQRKSPMNTLFNFSGTSDPVMDNLTCSQLMSLQSFLPGQAKAVTQMDVCTPLSLPNTPKNVTNALLPKQLDTNSEALISKAPPFSMQSAALTADDLVSPPPTQQEQLVDDDDVDDGDDDIDDDDMELADGIIQIQDYQTSDTVTTPPTKKLKSDHNMDCNTEIKPTGTGDIIQLQKPGVQLTVFHYNILPVVGNVYKVNSNYHLEKVKYESGHVYLCDDEGLLHKAQYVPYQLYQANSEGSLRAIGKVDGPISNP